EAGDEARPADGHRPLRQPRILEAGGDDPSAGPIRRELRSSRARRSPDRRVVPLRVPITHVAASLPSGEAVTAVLSHVSDFHPTRVAVPWARRTAEEPGRSAVRGDLSVELL